MKPTTTDILPQGYKMTELGPLPEEWEVVQLANKYIEFQNGLWKGKKEPYINVRVLRNTNFNNDGTIDFDDVAELDVEQRNFKNREIIKDDIILERSGGGPTQPVGRVVFFEKNDQLRYSFSNFTSRIRVIDKLRIFPKYLFFYLLNFYYQGKTNDIQNRTTGIRNLDFSKYKQISLPLPPLPEQQKIAAVLSAVQEAKEKTQAVIDATKTLKKSMMKHLFTYGPVSPEEAANVPLKETEIGKVPEEWKIINLDEIINLKRGISWRKDEANKEGIGIPVLGIPNIKENGKIDFTDTYFLTKKIPVDKMLRINDILFVGSSGSIKNIGRNVFIREIQKNKFTYASFTFLGRVDPLKANTEYIFYLLNSPIVDYSKYARRASDGKYNFQLTQFKNEQKIPLPPLPVQQKIATILSAIDAKIEAEENKKQALEDLFKTLLHNLMTAKIRVTAIHDLP
ncbi:MAG: type restriction enzyme subunit [Rikenellaceae bacterium]|nr:type restriction enzyme subunit [Rikenellaceae bacterium]